MQVCTRIQMTTSTITTSFQWSVLQLTECGVIWWMILIIQLKICVSITKAYLGHSGNICQKVPLWFWTLDIIFSIKISSFQCITPTNLVNLNKQNTCFPLECLWHMTPQSQNTSPAPAILAQAHSHCLSPTENTLTVSAPQKTLSLSQPNRKHSHCLSPTANTDLLVCQGTPLQMRGRVCHKI